MGARALQYDWATVRPVRLSHSACRTGARHPPPPCVCVSRKENDGGKAGKGWTEKEEKAQENKNRKRKKDSGGREKGERKKRKKRRKAERVAGKKYLYWRFFFGHGGRPDVQQSVGHLQFTVFLFF